MQEEMLAMALREAMWATLQLGGPLLGLLLVVGLAVSLLQALTQVQEATLAFLPKLVAGGIAMALLAPFMVAVLRGYAASLFDRMIALGGMP
jgi:flagellar biosynthesis protein FliQ